MKIINKEDYDDNKFTYFYCDDSLNIGKGKIEIIDLDIEKNNIEMLQRLKNGDFNK